MKKYFLSLIWMTCWLLSLIGTARAEEIPKLEKRVRPAAVAGSWYPGHPGVLQEYLDHLLAQASPPSLSGTGSVRALLVPHAGYAFTGPAAATGFKLVQGKRFKRVVVVGPSHYGSFTGLAVPDTTHFATPLGEIPLDIEAITQLLHQGEANQIPDVDRREHAIEMLLPWLQRALAPGWQLVPVLVGTLDGEGYARTAKALRPLLNDESLLVLSGDFTHYGPNYDYIPFPPDAKAAQALKKLDLGAWEQIVARDAKGFEAYRKTTGITACAFGPMAIFTHLISLETTSTLVSYTTSGPLSKENPNSVSYLVGAFTMPNSIASCQAQQEQAQDAKMPPKSSSELSREDIKMSPKSSSELSREEIKMSPESSSEFSREEMTLLYDMAKRAMELAVKQGPEAVSIKAMAAGFPVSDALKKPQGVFVTLKRGEDLRGCIGYIEPIKPLYEAVVENAVNAALRDHRFRPVEPKELSGLNLEVSVLSPLQPIDSYQAFKVGHHGVTLTKLGRRAVFLPHVAVEQGWNRDETLTQLSLKAGLPGDAWKENARFEIFTTQSYHAPLSP